MSGSSKGKPNLLVPMVYLSLQFVSLMLPRTTSKAVAKMHQQNDLGLRIYKPTTIGSIRWERNAFLLQNSKNC